MSDTLEWPLLISALLGGRDLRVAEATWAMERIVTGEVAAPTLAGFLVALRGKGETVDEIVGFRDAVLAHARPLPLPARALDLVGTGGDGFKTVNVSTTAAVIVAASGVPVTKHGNRAASSASGASDVLGALGLDLSLDGDGLARVFAEVGITFVWAAAFHPGFRHAAEARSAIGVPTVFNFLGPLVNPARPDANVIGVASQAAVPLVTGVLQTRGATALVVRGDDGLDELSTTGHSRIREVSAGAVTEHDVHPSDVGLPVARLDDLRGGTPVENAETLRRVLAGEGGPVRDIALLNAAAGLVAWDLYEDPSNAERPMAKRLSDAVERAARAVDSGAAREKLDAWVEATRSVSAG
ncbi:anthranilate phosphoribosyltransferase [Amnibacterium setariae]|uniref:Anthranilate phosphoribosyltransferase n=1 Tax=Amnibacterium setariae TaxID=2306585 RepID=A0A3A1U3V8_9MICO|nr:anthranilate phosphoribosyltransferase [Amnibacterium setariae]RIX27684.1 anthranilate phosphoribosyltransferase [Amnibacterium setariae]